jgi:hypothetical protein
MSRDRTKILGHINTNQLIKYIKDYNIKYAKGITQPEYSDYTMEFFMDT